MRGIHINGFAAVSEDGMLANADHVMPDALKVEEDQRFFENGVIEADVLVHGRHSQEPFQSTASKRRLILTRKIAELTSDESNPQALLWNPTGASFARALDALGPPHNRITIVGATEVFDLFLDHYQTFYLSRVAGVRLPGGTPVFKNVPAQTPEDILAAHGLVRAGDEVSTPKLTITRWERHS